MTATRRLARALHAALRGALDAYAETAWVYRYGPGFAPTAPVHFAAEPGDAAPAYQARALGTQAPAFTPGFAAPGFAQTPASRSPAHASASA